MDQVPRYFENEPKSTITKKGSKNILLRKSSSAHKRCTITVAITMARKLLPPHILFSNLKNKPSVSDGCLVDVNKTGMWNDVILDDYIKNNIINRKETGFFRQPILLLIDSYGPHVKLHETKTREKYNIFILLIPPNLTGILQPLDVVQNRSFQEFYSTQYDSYIATAVSDTNLQTKSGNAKITSYFQVSEMVLNWIKTQSEDKVKHAFSVCGIGSRDSFNVDNLHNPLKSLLHTLLNTNECLQLYGNTIAENCYIDEDPSEWFWPSEFSTKPVFLDVLNVCYAMRLWIL